MKVKRKSKKRRNVIRYKSSNKIAFIKHSGLVSQWLASGSFSPSASFVRPLSIDTVCAAVSMRMFCKARKVDYDDFFFLVQVYVFTVVAPARFFTYSDASGFTGLSYARTCKIVKRLDQLGWFQRVATGEKSVNWKKWKGPLTPKFQFMLAVRANNLLIEYWDYTEQIKANFKVDYLDDLPDIE